MSIYEELISIYSFSKPLTPEAEPRTPQMLILLLSRKTTKWFSAVYQPGISPVGFRPMPESRGVHASPMHRNQVFYDKEEFLNQLFAQFRANFLRVYKRRDRSSISERKTTNIKIFTPWTSNGCCR